MPRSPSVLDDLRPAAPCRASWSGMIGDDRTRRCAGCRLQAYSIVGLSREEAEELIERTERRLCFTFYERADGTILARDCPAGRRRRWFQRLTLLLAVFVVWLGTAYVPRRLGFHPFLERKVRRLDPFRVMVEPIDEQLAKWQLTFLPAAPAPKVAWPPPPMRVSGRRATVPRWPATAPASQSDLSFFGSGPVPRPPSSAPVENGVLISP